MNKNKIRENLTNEINDVQSVLSSFHSNLQLVKDDGLIDYYLYQIKAYEAKHKYLIDLYKKLENN